MRVFRDLRLRLAFFLPLVRPRSSSRSFRYLLAESNTSFVAFKPRHFAGLFIKGENSWVNAVVNAENRTLDQRLPESLYFSVRPLRKKRVNSPSSCWRRNGARCLLLRE